MTKKTDSLKKIRGAMKIMVVTGASGGHIFPALSFLDTLKEKHSTIDTLMVMPKKIYVDSTVLDSHKVGYVSISNIKLGLDYRIFLGIFDFLKGTLEGLILILEFRPNVVIGFGTLASVPLILFAWLFRIKTLIHEQNLIPGRANRFLAKLSDKIAISFEGSRRHLCVSSSKIVLTGNPIRRELKQMDKDKALGFFGLNSGKFTILVMGGSSGSHRINVRFFNVISEIKDRDSLQVIHLCGSQDFDWLKDGYKNLGVRVRVFRFLNQMEYAYSAAELLISRAGATTITEAISYRLPAIIIPYPFAYEHQVSNAKILTDSGCAALIKDSELDSTLFKQAIEDLMDNPKKIMGMHSRYRTIPQSNASDLLVDQVISLN